ncbi:MAG: 30S ribosomal protein S16 [Candidatus Shikimatogenerans bostrichidophilus]|nr:MAG: 30S ribosomal protein S16 [Candidatus Shikimatogenerans bostrichidophilus]
MVKIRLQRHGKKHYPIYYIVIANSKSPRDGKIIKKIGIYNPNLIKNKIFINDINDIKYWLNKGAQPTKTIMSILKTNYNINYISK